ncbi:MAG: hypothetical protein WKF66_16025 [Pedobacter sp.]
MKGSYYLLLLFPLSILIAGFIVLAENLHPTASRLTPQLTLDSTVTQTKRLDTIPKNDSIPVAQSSTKVMTRKTGNFGKVETKQEEKAMPYFILASVFIVVILVLPRLQELSISQQSLVIKLFKEVKEAADNLDEESSPLGAEALRTATSKEKIRILQDRIRTVDKILSKGK